MPTITRRDTEDLRAILTVHIAKEDYEKSVNKKLNDFRKKAHLKGFRKGQVPMSYVKKIYGKSVIADELNELAYKELIKYISDSDMQTIGQPLPVEDQPMLELEVRNYIDYDFEYEIGLMPPLDLKGLDKSITIDSFDIEVTDEAVQEEIDKYLKQQGDRKEVDEVRSENDLLMVNLIELEGDEPKADGLNKHSMVAIEDIQNEDLKKQILTLKKGDTFDADIYELVAESQSQDVRKYLLSVDDEAEFNNTFRVEIATITHMSPAEMSAELLVDAIGHEKAEKHVAEFLLKEDEEDIQEEIGGDSDLDIPEVVDLEGLGEEMEEKVISPEEKEAATKGMKEEIGLMIKEQSENAAKDHLMNKVMDELLEKNDIPLSDSYFKRWLTINNEGREISDEVYENTIKTIRANFVLDAVAKHLDVYTSISDVEAEMRNDYYERAGLDPENPTSDEQFQKFYEMMMQYDESFMIKRQSQLNNDNVKDKLEEIIIINKKKVTTTELNDILKTEYEEAKKKEEEQKAKEEEAIEVEVEEMEG